MEALLMGADGECITATDTSPSLFTTPTMYSLAPVNGTKGHSKIKCPGCMHDADIDLDFAKVEEDPGR